MKAIENFEELIAYLSGGFEPKRVAVVCPYDDGTQEAVERAMEAGFIKPIFVGDPKLIGPAMKEVTRLKATDEVDAAAKAVQ